MYLYLGGVERLISPWAEVRLENGKRAVERNQEEPRAVKVRTRVQRSINERGGWPHSHPATSLRERIEAVSHSGHGACGTPAKTPGSHRW